jgi:hypothetical protein
MSPECSCGPTTDADALVTTGRKLALSLAAATACLLGIVVTVLSTLPAGPHRHGAAAARAAALDRDLAHLGVILGVLGAMLALGALTALARDVRAGRTRSLPAANGEITVTAAGLASSARALSGLIHSLRVRVHAGDD